MLRSVPKKTAGTQKKTATRSKRALATKVRAKRASKKVSHMSPIETQSASIFTAAKPASGVYMEGLSNITTGGLTASIQSNSLAQALSKAPLSVQKRFMSTAELPANQTYLKKVRNIGISAHIDSGKTTLSERILFYGGRINQIHDVKGKDGVGAKMDSMDLEREKGITIQSAATQVKWKDHTVNLIDTPGHVDFTIEVERALRVLDGAILVLCSVGGVQSQSITVDRQMKRYSVPRIAFINKLDRAGGQPWKPIADMRRVLRLNAAAVQIPLGRESDFFGVVDIVTRKAYRFDGSSGEKVVEIPIPDDEKALMEEKRTEMLEHLGEVDDEIGEYYLNGEEPPLDVLKAAIRRQTIQTKFVPVFMGSAYKNKGVQLALDGVVDYLPNPTEITNTAFDNDNDEKQVVVSNDPSAPLVGLGFKLEESRFGQLTYLRVYQGTIKKGDNILDVNTNKKVKVPRLVRMSANEMEDVNEAKAGDIVALFGVECHSGTSFTDGSLRWTLSPITVPAPVISLAIKPKNPKDTTKFGKALSRFVKEDPTFTVTNDQESGQTLISGMGELHLDIYCERIRREYDCEVEVGYPEVNYRETIGKKAEFSYLHKKQSGGAGQYARVIGYIEPIEGSTDNEFVNALVGNNVPPEFVPAINKGFEECMRKGPQSGCIMQGVKFVIQDGQAHPVDSNEIAFRLATINGFKQAYNKANPAILEPVMDVEVTTPDEFQGSVISDLTQRRGMIGDVESRGDGSTVVHSQVPLQKLFGYSGTLRSMSQGKAEYAMTYNSHQVMPQEDASKVAEKYYASLRVKDDDM
jgi:elongation factor G